jgi:hypothetical protein
MTGMTSRARGWYPDPSGGPERKYWNGREWTDFVPPKNPRPRGSWTATIITAAVSVLLLAAGAWFVSSDAPPGYEELGAGMVIVGVLTAVAAVCVRVVR